MDSIAGWVVRRKYSEMNPFSEGIQFFVYVLGKVSAWESVYIWRGGTPPLGSPLGFGYKYPT